MSSAAVTVAAARFRFGIVEKCAGGVGDGKRRRRRESKIRAPGERESMAVEYRWDSIRPEKVGELRRIRLEGRQ